MQAGERQVAPDAAGIRRDHVARYEWAARRFFLHDRVVDFACGVGYGTKIIAESGCRATGFDIDPETIAYARQHYAHERVEYRDADGTRSPELGQYDAAVCFETIEHIADPKPLLVALRASAPVLLASVPNEQIFPFRNYQFHYRHYTKGQFEALLNETGWRVQEWWGQLGPQSEVEQNVMGRTLIAVATRGDIATRRIIEHSPAVAPATPERVAIVGLGPSASEYLELTKRQGGRRRLFDEVWAINAMGDVLACDRIFHMDDVRIQEIRAAAKPESNIAAMLRWLKTHPGPIYTSRTHPDYPGLVPYPLEEVVNCGRFAYLNSTAAHAVAYAVWLHQATLGQAVRSLALFGMDFTYPDGNYAEKGRACVEFWLALAASRGIKLQLPRTTSLMDGCLTQADRLYGYDTLDVRFDQPAREGDLVSIRFTEKAELPSAEEIEKRYDHSLHPSPLVETVPLEGTD